jgi:thiol:disulfide interchange protein DsbD
MTAFIAGLIWLSASTSDAAHTRATLVLSAVTARPGDTITAGIRLQMDPDWHTYWKNPGESGKATEIKWQLPPGITAGEIQWPLPGKLFAEELTTYVYHDEAVLLVPLKLAADLKPGPIDLKAKVFWLECETLCVPGSANVVASLEIGDAMKSSPEAALIGATEKKLPEHANNLAARAVWEKTSSADVRTIVIEWDASKTVSDTEFFPYSSDEFEVQGPTEPLPGDPGKVRLRKQVKKFEGEWPTQLRGVLVGKEDGMRRGWEVTLPLEASTGGKAAASPFSWAALLGALGFAFLGGLILNIMPCVLPVIALKIFSFVKQSGEAPGRTRRLGLIYTLGILASFVVLAGFVILVQQAGQVASWGMQMQNRNFVLGMTVLVTLVSLNLFGVFEVTLGGGTLDAADALARKSGAAGAFFNGVLATALAIPCTAPALATALGFAFTQPPLIVLLTFCFIALGLAAPYLVLTWNPALLRFLPKPGPWMQRFKVALGFPMLATVVWLYKLSVNHLNKSQALWFGIFLVTLAMAAWIWGEFVQRSSRRRGLAVLTSLLLIIVVGAYASTRREGIHWQPWSEAAVAQARAEGRPVLVDFTADWCLTCQLNLRTSLDVPTVRAKLAEVKAATLIGDYTLQDESIGKELHRFGRDAVPLVLVYPKDPAADPIVLPPVLRPQIVLDALEKAAK